MPRKTKRQALEHQAAGLLFDAYGFTAEKHLNAIEDAARALEALVDGDDEADAVALRQTIMRALAAVSNILHTPAHPQTA